MNKNSSLDLTKLFPNLVTLLGLCLGLSSIRLALHEKWELSITFLIIAAFVDAIDGRLARLLGSTSKFGAQLDSLSDFLNFGAAPVFMLYLWKANEIKGLGWAMVLLFVVCTAIRLARFNSELDETEEHKHFFSGVPAPAGALACLAPPIFTFAYKEHFPEIFQYLQFCENPAFVCANIAIWGTLMASRLPTISLKHIQIKHKFVSPVLFAGGLLAIALITELWITLSIIGIFYFISIPISAMMGYRSAED